MFWLGNPQAVDDPAAGDSDLEPEPHHCGDNDGQHAVDP